MCIVTSVRIQHLIHAFPLYTNDFQQYIVLPCFDVPSNASRKFGWKFSSVISCWCRTISTAFPADWKTCLCLCCWSAEQMETLFLLVLSTMYPYWTLAGPQSSLTSPRLSSCVRPPCPLKSSRLTLTCCPVCASNNHGCDREPHRTRCRRPLSLFSDEDLMCWRSPADTFTTHERSPSTTVRQQIFWKSRVSAAN